MNKKGMETALEKVPDYAVVFVEIKSDRAGFAAHFTDFMTMDGTGYICHCEMKVPDAVDTNGKVASRNLVVVADARNGVEYEKIKKYLSTPDAYRLYIKTIPGLSEDDIKAMHVEIERQVKANIKYDGLGILSMTVKALLTKIPIIGFFINKFIWNLPNINDSSRMFCTESVGNIIRAPKDAQGNIKYPCPVCVPPIELYNWDGLEFRELIECAKDDDRAQGPILPGTLN
jgi:hypothetical protein